LGTLSTENRPLPTSATGQFETWSESQIPGGSLNAKIKYVGKNFQAGAGVGIRKNKLEYHAMIGIKDKIKFTAWHSTYNEEWGIAGTLKTKKVYNTFAIKTGILANIFVLHLPKEIDFYLDTGYDFLNADFGKGQLVRAEIGILKNFKFKYGGGLIGLGYANETRTVNGYLFLHL